MQLREFLVKKSIRAKELKDFSILPVYGVSNVDGICVTGNNPGEKKDEYVLIEENDFAYNPYRVNVGSIGLTPKGMKGLVSPAYVVFQTNENLLPELLWSFIKSKEGLTQIISHARGTVRKALRFEDLCKIDMYIPPKNEQKKILKKLQNLNSKIQNLKSETSYQLDLLKKLKQQILQDAVKGKLVKQNPKDEPASVLLKKIKAEKEKLINEKKLKPGKPLAPIKEEEIPFQIPDNWVWCRLQNITILITDGKHGDCDNQSNSGYYFLSAKDIQNNKLIYDNSRQITYKDFEEVHKRTNLEPGDLCIVNTGATIGKTAIALNNSLTRKTTFQKSVAIIKLLKYLTDVKYVEILLKVETPNLLKTSRGSAINNLLLRDLSVVLFPLPPLSEQHRIVSKVEELIKKCDELESSIKQGQIYTEKLMQSVLRDALKPGGRI